MYAGDDKKLEANYPVCKCRGIDEKKRDYKFGVLKFKCLTDLH